MSATRSAALSIRAAAAATARGERRLGGVIELHFRRQIVNRALQFIEPLNLLAGIFPIVIRRDLIRQLDSPLHTLMQRAELFRPRLSVGVRRRRLFLFFHRLMIAALAWSLLRALLRPLPAAPPFAPIA